MVELKDPFDVTLSDCEGMMDGEKQQLTTAVHDWCVCLRNRLSANGSYAVIICGSSETRLNLSFEECLHFENGSGADIARQADALERMEHKPAFLVTAGAVRLVHPYHHFDSAGDGALAGLVTRLVSRGLVHSSEA